MANGSQIINQYLQSRGITSTQGEKFPLFNVRKDLYSKLGLDQSLGGFVGSEVQNSSLLNQLQKGEKDVGVKISPDNLGDIASLTRQGFNNLPGQGGQAGGATPGLGNTYTTPSGAVIETATGKMISNPNAQATQPTQTSQQLPATELTGGMNTGGGLGGADATGLLPEMPSGSDLASQALEQVQSSATFPLQMEAQEAQKSAVQLGAQRQTQDFIKNIASRGLFFSGAKSEGVSNIEVDKLANLLNIDRSFAMLMAQGLETAAQGIAKEAARGRTEAIDSLETLGFAINPITGKVEPTLQARKAIATEERAEVTEQRQENQFQLSIAKAEEQSRQFETTQARLTSQAQAQQELNNAKFNLSIAKSQEDLIQAQQRIAISEENLAIAQAREARLEKTALDTNTYTGIQLGKLRAFGISVSDTEAADTLLFKGEEEYKQLVEVREKGGDTSFSLGGYLDDPFMNVWSQAKGFFGF